MLPLCDTKNLITILSTRLTESESDPSLYNEDLTVNEDRVEEIQEEINLSIKEKIIMDEMVEQAIFISKKVIADYLKQIKKDIA